MRAFFLNLSGDSLEPLLEARSRLQPVTTPECADTIILSGTPTIKWASTLLTMKECLSLPVSVIALGSEACSVPPLSCALTPSEGIEHFIPVSEFSPQWSSLEMISESTHKPIVAKPQPVSLQATSTDNTLTLGPSWKNGMSPFELTSTLEGNLIENGSLNIGFTYRGLESFLTEAPVYHHISRIADWDPFQSGFNVAVYCMALEKLTGITLPPRAHYLRMIESELFRLLGLAHALFKAMNATDELNCRYLIHRILHVLFESHETVFGKKIGGSLSTPGGCKLDLSPNAFQCIQKMTPQLRSMLLELSQYLSHHTEWVDLSRGKTALSKNQALEFGLTGPNLRATGVNWDLRHQLPYSKFENIHFSVPVGTRGDIFDRIMVRILEMQESLNILDQTLQQLPLGPFLTENDLTPLRSKPLDDQPLSATSLKQVVSTFKSPKLLPDQGSASASLESARGIVTCMIECKNKKISRVRFCTPSSALFGLLPEILKGESIQWAPLVIASLDFHSVEIDK